MLRRVFFASLALGFGGAAVGCQVIAQLSSLEVGAGGAGGSTASSNNGSTTGSTSHSSTGSSSHSSTTTSSASSTSGAICGLDAGTCTPGGPCTSCMQGICQEPCTASLCNITIDATNGPVAVQCNDTTCTEKTFTCKGDHLCELDCNVMNSCLSTTLDCGTGPCRLKCVGQGCGPKVPMSSPPTQLNCGVNACDTIYMAPTGMNPPVLQACGSSCDCTHVNLGG